MAENPNPEWKQAACKWCREGRRIVMELHHDSADGEWLLGCTAPTEAQHIKNLTAELDTANEVIRQIAQMFGVTDTRHILGDLGRVKAGIGVMRTALQEVFDYFMGPQACGDFTCNCGKTDACGTCEIRESTRAALSHEAVAGEAERQKDDPIRKALEGLVLEVSSLLEAQSIGVKRYARMWPIVVAAREALKGAKP